MRVNRVVGAYDAGRIINPKTARSQAIGGIIWGVGQALLEQSETDPTTGRFVNRNYSGYLVPTNADIPELDILFVGEFDEEASPLGAKGPRRADGRIRGAGDRECRLSRDRQANTRSADHDRKAVVKRAAPASQRRTSMSEPERFEILILGSGQGGKLLAWHLARSGRRTASVERRWIGGSCPNIACLPSKNEVWSARIAHMVHHAAQFGTTTGSVATDMAKVRQRKRDMVEPRGGLAFGEL